MALTEPTVTVPVSELQRLRAWYPSLSGSTPDDPIGVLIGLIPDPPKVGDVIDSADAAKALPVGTVLRDNTQDVWVVTEGQHLHYINPRKTSPFLTKIDDPAFEYYKPVIIDLPDNA